jgi:hypothetical protein
VKDKRSDAIAERSEVNPAGITKEQKEKKPKLFLSTRNPHSYSPLRLCPKSGNILLRHKYILE